MKDFTAIRTQAIDLLQREGHVAYRALPPPLPSPMRGRVKKLLSRYLAIECIAVSGR
jgi:hypothetical protein